MKTIFKRLTASVLAAALLLALLPAVSPQAAASSVSDWVLASEAPSWAQITERKYTYDLTTTTESTATSLDGYTCYGSYWKQTGSNAFHYATFPGGYDPNHAYYTGWHKSCDVTAYENTTNKRTVSTTWAGYVYWHWMYNVAYANSTNRAISSMRGSYGGKSYIYFYAFVSTVDCPYLDNLYCNSQSLPSYYCHSVLPETNKTGIGTPRFFRFNYYTCSYQDFQKIFQYTKTEQKESATYPEGAGISNVQEWVKYLLQTNVSFDVNYASAPVNHMRAPTVEAGWTKEENGTLSLSLDGVSVIYDPADESFTFDAEMEVTETQNIPLYRIALDEPLPQGSYLNLSVRRLGGSYTRSGGCLVIEGATPNSYGIAGERCHVDIYPPENGEWLTVTAGPLTENQSANLGSILLWLWVSESVKLEQLKLQFSVSFTDRPLTAEELRYTPVEKSVFCNDAYGTLPQPERKGYSFAGWYTQRSGGELITAETVMNRNEPHTLYAAWTANSYPLHLDAQGGTVESPLGVTYDKPIGELPTPVWEGYRFLGWYTEPKGGTLVEASQMVDFTEDRTVYACWIPEALLSCGEGLSWKLEGNRLTLSGNGAMQDYAAGESPFSLLSGYIRELVIENGVTALGSYALAGVSGITSLRLPESVERLGEGALDGCTGLTTIRVENPNCQLCKLPENLSQIIGYSGSTAEAYATEHGIAFQSLGFYRQDAELSYWYRDEDNTLYISGSGALPDYVIGEAPWYAKRLTLQTVRMSGEITYLGNNSFAGCEQLSVISLPKTVKNFGENVFEDTLWYRTKPEGVVILNGVVYGFRDGGEESNVVLSGGTTKIESNFSLGARAGEQGLKSLQISSSVSKIEDGALGWFGQLSELTVQNGNTAYRTVDHVLYSKDMTQLVCYPAGLGGEYRLPASVTQIRPYAFAGCTALTELHLGRELTSIGADAFVGSGLQTIYGYYDSYAREYAEKNGYSFVPYTSTVTFDSNNGERSTVEIATGCAIGTLPTPAQEGYRFMGWFLETEQEDVQITADFVVTEDITLLAFWEELPVPGPYLVDLSILSLPKKLDYFCGESILTEGLSLQARYSDGTVHTVTEGLSCVPSRLNTPGSQLVTVYYAGMTASFRVQVTEVVPVSLTLISLPKVLTYYVTESQGEGSVLNTQGLIGLVEFNNGTQRLINNSAEFEYIYDLSKPTDSTSVNVNYRQGDVVVAAFYQVQVLEKPILYSESLKAKTGEEITVPIYISGNTGLMGLGVELYYDASVLVPETISGNMAGTIGWDKGFGEDGSIKILWSHSEEYRSDGLLFAVNFRILPDAAAGESAITVAYLEEDSFNGSYENVQFVCNPAMVQVERVEKPTFYSQALTAPAGSYLDVPVYYKNNVGVEDLSIFTLSYDASVFDYVQQVGESDAVFKITQQEGKLKIVLNAVSKAQEDGLLFTLRFRVKTDAEGSYRFAYMVDDSRWECQDGIAQIIGVVLQPTIFAAAQTAAPGEPVSVAVELKENPGLMGYHLRLPYDPSVLTISAVKGNTSWGGNFDYAVEAGVLEVLWTNSENVTENGLLFTVELSATAAGEYTLQWESVAEDTYNEAWEAVTLQCQPMSLTIRSHEHTDRYQNNANGSHDVLCPGCGELLRDNEPHSFAKGVCACGAVQWTKDSNVLIQHSLNLASDISINFVVQKSRLTAYDSFYMECVLPIYEGNTLKGTQTTILQPVLNGNYYYFTLEGMSAIRMNDMVSATLRMMKNGEGYCSAEDLYSVGTYAYTVLGMPSSTEKMRTLCANLLRYGSAAQTFKGYRSDALADAAMTEEQRSWMTDLNEVAFSNTDYFKEDLANPSISWVGKTLMLDSKVGIKYVFNVANYTGDLSELSLRVSYHSNSGEEKSVVLTDFEAYNSARGYYCFTFYGLLAAELRQTMEVAVYRGEEQLSKTMVYSAASYGSNPGVTGNLKTLSQALFAYSDAALKQFSK